MSRTAHSEWLFFFPVLLLCLRLCVVVEADEDDSRCVALLCLVGCSAAVQILKEDIELVMRELDVTKQKAESLLSSAGGSVQEALLAYLRS